MMVAKPDWQALLLRLSRRMSDAYIVIELAKIGVDAERSTITKLRNGNSREPFYSLGKGLELLDEKVSNAPRAAPQNLECWARQRRAHQMPDDLRGFRLRAVR